MIRHGSAVIDFPHDLEIVIRRDFEAPIGLVFDVLTKPEHVRQWGATPPDEMLECEIDLRVGGSYRSSFRTGDGQVFVIHGTYLEVEPPTRTRQTWVFEMWPDVDVVEAFELSETDGVTTFTWRLTFADEAGRAHMSALDGQVDSLDAIEKILRSLLANGG
ncbi:MAG TPA: SRPBCC domain-containing protein [Nocardioides sp.]|nr:SRPBCC domain-containing protein [Nocardioides sp.]